jgi:hypothetical protein
MNGDVNEDDNEFIKIEYQNDSFKSMINHIEIND